MDSENRTKSPGELIHVPERRDWDYMLIDIIREMVEAKPTDITNLEKNRVIGIIANIFAGERYSKKPFIHLRDNIKQELSDYLQALQATKETNHLDNFFDYIQEEDRLKFGECYVIPKIPEEIESYVHLPKRCLVYAIEAQDLVEPENELRRSIVVFDSKLRRGKYLDTIQHIRGILSGKRETVSYREEVFSDEDKRPISDKEIKTASFERLEGRDAYLTALKMYGGGEVPYSIRPEMKKVSDHILQLRSNGQR